MKYRILAFLTILLSVRACAQNQDKRVDDNQDYPIQKSEAEWKAQLDDKQYYVLREKGTERAFSGEYNKFYKDGMYHCAACNAPLFSSSTKFDSGTGWPSFYEVAPNGKVGEVLDRSHGMVRAEVVCSQCGGHLGHVFNDGPKPTGLRYCLNSVSLQFKEAE